MEDKQNNSIAKAVAEGEDEDERMLLEAKENIEKMKKEFAEWDEITTLCPPVVNNGNLEHSNFVNETLQMLKSVEQKRERAAKILMYNQTMSRNIKRCSEASKIEADCFQAYENVKSTAKY